jgi:hypothetical protein
MYDLKKSHFSLILQKDVAAGNTVDREGVVLRSVLEAGNEKVQKADAAAATYSIAGFAISDNETVGIMPFVEDAVIPAAPGPHTIQLKHGNLVGAVPNSSVRVWDRTTNADLAEVAGAPAANQVQVVALTGLLTFNVANAGQSVRVFYRANLTVAEAKLRYFERGINNQAGAVFNTVAVGGGVGEIYTSEYDSNVDWSGAIPGGVGLITSGTDGIVTIGGAGTPIPGARVVHVPDPDNAMLGIAFNTTP